MAKRINFIDSQSGEQFTFMYTGAGKPSQSVLDQVALEQRELKRRHFETTQAAKPSLTTRALEAVGPALEAVQPFVEPRALPATALRAGLPVVGALGGPAGIAAGTMAGELGAQTYEEAVGIRPPTPVLPALGVGAVEAGLNILPVGPLTRALGPAKGLVTAGALQAPVSAAARIGIEQQRLARPEELVAPAVFGGAVGGVVGKIATRPPALEGEVIPPTGRQLGAAPEVVPPEAPITGEIVPPRGLPPVTPVARHALPPSPLEPTPAPPVAPRLGAAPEAALPEAPTPRALPPTPPAVTSTRATYKGRQEIPGQASFEIYNVPEANNTTIAIPSTATQQELDTAIQAAVKRFNPPQYEAEGLSVVKAGDKWAVVKDATGARLTEPNSLDTAIGYVKHIQNIRRESAARLAEIEKEYGPVTQEARSAAFLTGNSGERTVLYSDPDVGNVLYDPGTDPLTGERLLLSQTIFDNAIQPILGSGPGTVGMRISPEGVKHIAKTYKQFAKDPRFQARVPAKLAQFFKHKASLGQDLTLGIYDSELALRDPNLLEEIMREEWAHSVHGRVAGAPEKIISPPDLMNLVAQASPELQNMFGRIAYVYQNHHPAVLLSELPAKVAAGQYRIFGASETDAMDFFEKFLDVAENQFGGDVHLLFKYIDPTLRRTLYEQYGGPKAVEWANELERRALQNPSSAVADIPTGGESRPTGGFEGPLELSSRFFDERGSLAVSAVADAFRLPGLIDQEFLTSAKEVIRRDSPAGQNIARLLDRRRTWGRSYAETLDALPSHSAVNDIIQRAGMANVNLGQIPLDPRELRIWLHSSAQRVVDKELKLSQELVNQVKSSKDPAKVEAYIKHILTPQQDTVASQIVRGVAKFETFAHLSKFVISNLNALSMIPIKSNFTNFIEGLARSFTQEGKKFAKSSGALYESVRYEMLDQSPSWIAKVYGIPASEGWQRTVAANSGRAAAKRLFTHLKSNPQDQLARRQLSELTLEDPTKVLSQGILTDDQLKHAGARMAELTQGLAGREDLPRAWTGSPYAAIPLLFKRYAFVGTRLMKEAIKEKPLRNLLLAFGLYSGMGELTGDVKKGISGGIKAVIEDKDILKGIIDEIANRGDWRKKSILGSKGFEEISGIKLSNNQRQVLNRMTDNIVNSWMLGLPGDYLEALSRGEKGALEFMAGPALEHLATFSDATLQALRRKPEKLIREMKRLVPFVGQELARVGAPTRRPLGR